MNRMGVSRCCCHCRYVAVTGTTFYDPFTVVGDWTANGATMEFTCENGKGVIRQRGQPTPNYIYRTVAAPTADRWRVSLQATLPAALFGPDSLGYFRGLFCGAVVGLAAPFELYTNGTFPNGGIGDMCRAFGTTVPTGERSRASWFTYTLQLTKRLTALTACFFLDSELLAEAEGTAELASITYGLILHPNTQDGNSVHVFDDLRLDVETL